MKFNGMESWRSKPFTTAWFRFLERNPRENVDEVAGATDD
jgi:hypothetical protein